MGLNKGPLSSKFKEHGDYMNSLNLLTAVPSSNWGHEMVLDDDKKAKGQIEKRNESLNKQYKIREKLGLRTPTNYMIDAFLGFTSRHHDSRDNDAVRRSEGLFFENWSFSQCSESMANLSAFIFLNTEPSYFLSYDSSKRSLDTRLIPKAPCKCCSVLYNGILAIVKPTENEIRRIEDKIERISMEKYSYSFKEQLKHYYRNALFKLEGKRIHPQREVFSNEIKAFLKKHLKHAYNSMSNGGTTYKDYFNLLHGFVPVPTKFIKHPQESTQIKCEEINESYSIDNQGGVKKVWNSVAEVKKASTQMNRMKELKRKRESLAMRVDTTQELQTPVKVEVAVPTTSTKKRKNPDRLLESVGNDNRPKQAKTEPLVLKGNYSRQVTPAHPRHFYPGDHTKIPSAPSLGESESRHVTPSLSDRFYKGDLNSIPSIPFSDESKDAQATSSSDLVFVQNSEGDQGDIRVSNESVQQYNFNQNERWRTPVKPKGYEGKDKNTSKPKFSSKVKNYKSRGYRR